MSSDIRIAFRFEVDKMIHHKSVKYQERVWDKINKILEYTKTTYISSETVAYIMVGIDTEYGELR